MPESLGERDHESINLPPRIAHPGGWLASGLGRTRCLVLGFAVLALAACSGGGGGDDASSASTTVATSVPVTTPPVATAPTSTCPGFVGSTTVLKSVGPTAPASLIDAQAGAAGCLDQVTFTFNGAGIPPGYTVGYENPDEHPFLDGDPPEPISLPGAAFLVVRITPALSFDPFAADMARTYTGNLSLEYGAHQHLQIVRELPDATNTVVWVIGLDSVRQFRVDRAEDPRRVTVLIG
jgi:hypothetical protein